MKKLMIALAAPVALAASPMPLLAQDASADAQAEMDRISQMLAATFTSEPLTAEQEARLVLASEVVGQVMPDGTYARMMEGTLGQILEPMTAIMPSSMSAPQIARHLGQDVGVIDALEVSDIEAISAAVDPNFSARLDAGMSYMMDEMLGMIVQLEPAMRDGLSRAYAVRFDQQQLSDINSFFATETGAFYATESLLVFTDPQVMSASMQAMPVLMEQMPRIIGEVEAVMAQYGEARGFDALSSDDRGQIAQLLGVSVDTLKQDMEAAALDQAN